MCLLPTLVVMGYHDQTGDFFSWGLGVRVWAVIRETIDLSEYPCDFTCLRRNMYLGRKDYIPPAGPLQGFMSVHQYIYSMHVKT